MSHTLLGIVMGLLAAFWQASSYIFSSLFIARTGAGPFALLVPAHIYMGLASLAILPLLRDVHPPPVAGYGGYLFGAAAFYIVGQTGLVLMVRRVRASTVSPLLALKLIVLAAFTVLWLRQPLGPWQWAGILAAVAGAFLVNRFGQALSPRFLALLAVSCIAYSGSDLNIERLVRALAPDPTLRESAFGAAWTYILCGAAAVALLPFAGRITRAQWLYAAPFAACWFLGMVFLYGCFGQIGAVFGNILQSTRGILSILMGAALAHAGLHELDHPVDRALLLRRCFAGAVMTAAVFLYMQGR